MHARMHRSKVTSRLPPYGCTLESINSGTLRLQDELARYASLNIAVRESTKQPTLALDLIRRHPQAIRLGFAEDPSLSPAALRSQTKCPRA